MLPKSKAKSKQLRRRTRQKIKKLQFTRLKRAQRNTLKRCLGLAILPAKQRQQKAMHQSCRLQSKGRWSRTIAAAPAKRSTLKAFRILLPQGLAFLSSSFSKGASIAAMSRLPTRNCKAELRTKF